MAKDAPVVSDTEYHTKEDVDGIKTFRGQDEALMKPVTTFRTGAALAKDFICLSGAMDELPDFEKYTRVITFDEHDEPIWSFHEENDVIFSIAVWRHPVEKYKVFVTLSEEGNVAFLDQDLPARETIPDAGVSNPTAKNYGYVTRIRQIGDHLYVCGAGGQVYKRSGENQWAHMDAGLLQIPPVDNRLLLDDINGASEADIYACGSYPGPSGLEGYIFHFDGRKWTPLKTPIVGYLNAIYVENADRIWMCGHNGALLLGNARQGFKNLSQVEDNQLFYSITMYKGKVYLGSNLGLFSYDPNAAHPRIAEVSTGLTPELQDTGAVDAVDGVLWSMGAKDIARFDGKKWQRIHHPDNPRIGP